MISKTSVEKVPNEYLIEYNKFLEDENSKLKFNKKEESNLEVQKNSNFIFRKIEIKTDTKTDTKPDIYILEIKNYPDPDATTLFFLNKVKQPSDGATAKTLISTNKGVLEKIVAKDLATFRLLNYDDDELFNLITSLLRKPRVSKNNNNNNNHNPPV